MHAFRSALLLLLLFIGFQAPARAEVVITFYSRDFGETFPHAFFTLKGTLAGEPAPIDTNYGFTAVTVSPAVLWGAVAGKVETSSVNFVRKSEAHMSMPISDTQYRAVMAVVEKWRTRPGRSYDLNKHNCIHFVAEVGRAVGLAVVEDPKLMKKPRSFLEDVRRQNPALPAAGGSMMAR